MKHRGELLNQVLMKLGIRKGYLAKKLGVHRNTVTNLIQAHDIPDQKLLEIGRLINYNFADDLPELLPSFVEEPQPSYQKKYTLDDCRGELVAMQRKYIKLQEKYIELLSRQIEKK